MPGGIGARIVKELVGFCEVDAWFPAAVGLAAEAIDDVLDDGLKGPIRRGISGHDAVAVELGLGEDPGGVAGVAEADGFGVGFAEVDEDLTGRGEDLGSFRRGVLNALEADFIGFFEEIIRILEQAPSPFGCGDDLGNADVAILVRVNEVERLGVELESASWATQGDPEFLVELVQGQQIPSRGKVDLVKSANAKEAPVVRGSGSVSAVGVWIHDRGGQDSVCRVKLFRVYMRLDAL